MHYFALKMLTSDRGKYLGLVFAIAFATFLLENQTSIFAGIMKRTAHRILDVGDADVWVMNPQTLYFDETKPLRNTDLLRVRGVPDVDYAVQLFKGNPVARAENGRFAVTVTMGLDDATLVGVPRRMILGSWERLREPQSVVIDQSGYFQLFPGEPMRLDRRLELNDHKATIVGISDALPGFVNFPVVHARFSEAVQYQGMERNQMSFVLARPQTGVDPVKLARQIEARTGLRARTSNEFAWDCIGYYIKNSGIPINFGITIAIAVLIGLVVSGQTLYLFTIEHLHEFAVLKAVGITNVRLVQMILLQAITAGLLGFSVGTGMAAGFFEITLCTLPARHVVLLWHSVFAVGVMMLLVVVLASLLSIRRVLVLEPVLVFR